jgi:hypothetical protein
MSASPTGPALSGRFGMIGLVRPSPRRRVDPELKRFFLEVAGSGTFAELVVRYNDWARRFGRGVVQPSAPIEDILRTLDNDTTFYRTTSNVFAAVFVPGEHNAPTNYLMQANRTSFLPTTAERTARHELLHLGAALRGQKDVLRHEIIVQLLTTPEVLLGYGGAVLVLGVAAPVFLR